MELGFLLLALRRLESCESALVGGLEELVDRLALLLRSLRCLVLVVPEILFLKKLLSLGLVGILSSFIIIFRLTID